MNENIIKYIEAEYATMDLSRIIKLFSKDVRFRLNLDGWCDGIDNLHTVLSKRYKNISNYSIKKKIIGKTSSGLVLEVNAQYILSGRETKSRIIEILEFKGDLISLWDYVGVSKNVGDVIS